MWQGPTLYRSEPISKLVPSAWKYRPWLWPISPLEGEMPGRAEGGMTRADRHYSAASSFPAIRRDRRDSSS